MTILWIITGASHFLEESINFLEDVDGVDVVLTQSGEQVCRFLDVFRRVEDSAKKIYLESRIGASPMMLTSITDYDKVVVAPCTANTLAKIRYGIADTLASNLVAQALKKKIRVLLFPTDKEKEIKTNWSGKEISLTARGIDLENLREVKKQKGIQVVGSPSELRKVSV